MMSGAISTSVAITAASLIAVATRSEPGHHAPHHEFAQEGLFVEASDPVDEGLMYPDTGPVILMNTHSSRADNSGWIEFGMGACGQLQRVDNRRTLLQQTHAEDFEGDDDDPAADGRALLGLWLSEHAEVAVISDAVDRACDDYWFGDEGFDTDEIA